jgi:hypothetical protein
MAKKSRKARTKFRNEQQSDNAGNKPPVSINAGIVTPVRATAGGSVSSLASRHQHVVPELIRISIIAAVLFVIIIILSFIIG